MSEGPSRPGSLPPPGPVDGSPGPGPDAAPPAGGAQGPRPGPGQGDAPWQRGDGPAGPAPVPDPDSLWVTGGVLLAGVLMLCQGVVAAYRGPGWAPGDALRRP